MKVQISKWGNSLGVRLPKAVAEALALKPGQTLDMVVENGVVELRPAKIAPRIGLKELVAEMIRLGPQNQPPLEDWGPDVGAEIIDDEYSRGEIGPPDLKCEDEPS